MKLLSEMRLVQKDFVQVRMKLHAVFFDGLYIYVSKRISNSMYAKIGKIDSGSIIVFYPICKILVDESFDQSEHNQLLCSARRLKNAAMSAGVLYDDDQLFSKNEIIEYIPNTF